MNVRIYFINMEWKMIKTNRKRIIMVLLSMILLTLMLNGCGANDIQESPKEETLTINDEVSVLTMDGLAEESTKGLPDKCVVKTVSDSVEMEDAVRTGSYDIAILDTASAARMYEKTKGDVVEISPIEYGDIKVVEKNYEQTEVTRNVYNEKTNQYEEVTEKLETPLTYLRSRKVIAFGSENSVLDVTFNNVFAKSYVYFYEGQVEWTTDVSDFKDKVENQDYVGVGYDTDIDPIMKDNSDIKMVFDVSDEWYKLYDMEIPKYVLIANKKFYSNRTDDFNAFINKYADTNGKTEGVVFYKESNRGLDILKKYNDTLEGIDIEAVGGEKIPSSIYWKR